MTAQCPEILHYRNVELELCGTPLYEYLARLRKDRRPKFLKQSTACYRGYIGTWEISDGHLYLVGLEGLLETSEGLKDASLATALPWVRGRLAAKWVTGRLRCIEGRLIDYVHHAYASTYERDRYLCFEQGQLVGEYLVLNAPVPVYYRIEPDGSRTCIDAMRYGHREIPDPLEGEPLENAWKVWGRKPADDRQGYVVAAQFITKY